MNTNLEAMAKRVEADPFYLACTLRGYSASEGLDDTGLATVLSCTLETLTLLRLCRAPDPERFKQDIDEIASRFAVDRDALARAARQGQAILHMRRDTPSDHGMLLAARDSEEKPPEAGP